MKNFTACLFKIILKIKLTSKLRFLILLYFVSITKLLSQNQITFRQLSVKEGLSQNSAIAITQDSIGNLWIATQDGLNKYDGRKFTTYPFQFVDITRPNYSILGQIYIDKQNQLWIIPDDKIPYKFDYLENTFNPLVGISDAYTMLQDYNHNYWITTFSNELFFVDGKTYETSLIPFNRPLKNMINEIEQVSKNTIVLLGNNELIEVDIHSKKPSFIELKAPFGEKVEGNFSTILSDHNGKQWLGTYDNGLFFKDTSSTILKRVPENTFKGILPDDLNILDLHLDTKNRLWVATYGKGLFMLDMNTSNIRHFEAEKQNPRALHYNDILCIYEDYLGTLWFGTDGAGASYYDENLEKFNSFTNNQTPENINIDVVRAIGVDSSENIWIGTSGKGLTSYNYKNDTWKTYSVENSGLPSDRIISLLPDGEDLWVGTQGEGLSIINKDGVFTDYSKNTEIKLSAGTIWDIYKDTSNNYWLATRDNGLIRFNKNEGELDKYISGNNSKNSLPSSNIRVITEDKNQNLWLGTDSEGLIKFNPQNNTFIHYTVLPEKNSISNNSIKSLMYTSNDILWIGTGGGGLNALDIKTGMFHVYTTSDGLANNVIYSIIPDSRGNLWLSSNKGITSVTLGNTFEEPLKISNYTNYDGLATEFNTGAYWKDAKGFLYFGGLDGFYWFKPETIKRNNILPKTAITGLDVLNEPQPLSKEMILDHDKNTLAFTFSSMQFSLPEKNKYRYRLLNYDNDWVDAGNKNYVRYTRLPPGNYTFQVKSSNYDGVWNPLPENYTFLIKAPWYFNTLSKTFYILAFFALCYIIFKYLNWRLKMLLNLQQKEEEANRLQKLNKFKSKFYTNIAHEFKTPLTLISGPIEKQLSYKKSTDSDFSSLSMVKRNTHRLIALVDQLLQLSKLEEGKLTIQLQEAELSLFVHSIVSSFEYQAKEKNLHYKNDIEITGKVWYDEDIIEKIVTNLLSNAFKYVPNKGHCSLTLKTTKDRIKIDVKNTVIDSFNIPVEKLFERFYQENEQVEGIGVGLSLVKELVTLSEGSINARMENKRTIVFEVELPSNERPIFSENIPNKFEEQANGLLNLPFEKKDLPILLIVEDHAEIRAFIKESLAEAYQFLEADNGKVGLEIALKKIPDIIISDVRMPILDGIGLCNALKADERTSHIPIILLTANDTSEMELKGLTSGADDFVGKPFKIRLLEKRIDNLISTRRALQIRYGKEFVLKPKNILVNSADEIFLNKIQEILDNHLSDSNFNAAEFSKKAHMSRMQLHRKLLAFTGLTTTAFLRSQRLKQAKQLLQDSDATISEIAYAVGFGTPTYFMKSFKETFGQTPSEYMVSADN